MAANLEATVGAAVGAAVDTGSAGVFVDRALAAVAPTQAPT
jgi:hypothetical protein